MSTSQSSESESARTPADEMPAPEEGSKAGPTMPPGEQAEGPECETKGNKCLSFAVCLRKNWLCLATLIGVILGIVLGVILKMSRSWNSREIIYVNFLGTIFLDILTCLVLPFITSSIVMAVGSLDINISGKLGLRAAGLYLITTVLAIVLGIVLVLVIRPGGAASRSWVEQDGGPKDFSLAVDSLMDLVRNLFPPNIIEAAVSQRVTVLELPAVNFTRDLSLWTIHIKRTDGLNILGIVLCTLVLGVALAKLGEAGKPLLDVFSSLLAANKVITKIVICVSPVAVIFLVATKILEMDNVEETLEEISLYTVTVLLGLFIHGAGTLPALFFAVTRKNPYRFAANMSMAISTAFATCSSSATLPVTIRCMEEYNGVDPRVSRFVLPIGATVNMDGTALYEAVAAIFIAQVNHWNFSIVEVLIISITATAGSIGAAGIPQSGLVIMVMVLQVAHLPRADISLILVVDWLLDRFRTVTNISGDAFVAGIINHVMAEELQHSPEHSKNDRNPMASEQQDHQREEIE